MADHKMINCDFGLLVQCITLTLGLGCDEKYNIKLPSPDMLEVQDMAPITPLWPLNISNVRCSGLSGCSIEWLLKGSGTCAGALCFNDPNPANRATVCASGKIGQQTCSCQIELGNIAAKDTELILLQDYDFISKMSSKPIIGNIEFYTRCGSSNIAVSNYSMTGISDLAKTSRLFLPSVPPCDMSPVSYSLNITYSTDCTTKVIDEGYWLIRDIRLIDTSSNGG